MLLKGEQLAAHLDRDLKAVYVVYGDEPLLVIEAADAIRASARRRGFDEREVLTAISGFNWNELHLSAGNMSLFGGRKLIDLRIPTGKPGREGEKPFRTTAPGRRPTRFCSSPCLVWTGRRKKHEQTGV